MEDGNPITVHNKNKSSIFVENIIEILLLLREIKTNIHTNVISDSLYHYDSLRQSRPQSFDIIIL